ncbi:MULTISPECIES: SDR family oxidoreductase [Sphingobacterium]|nr:MULTISPECIES: NmrA family NAD(P)-binding protein [Sphingobacterium]QIH34771.1 NmrA family NAD(P)-binding protein [Sphingobacterium sp. DR205]
MKILVFGATGSQQFNVISEGIKKGAEVIAATSSGKSFEKLSQAGATPVLANLSDAQRIVEITKDIDAIAFMIPVSLQNPFDGLQYAKNVIDAAKKNSVKKIVWNTSGWLESEKVGSPVDDVKLDVRDYLQNSGINYVIIEPTIYMENLMGGFCAPFIKNEKKLAYPTPEAMPIGWIASRDVSAFVVEAIYNQDLTSDSFQISGLENLSGNETADNFSKGVGENIVYYPQPPKEFKDILTPFVGEAGAASVASYYESLQNANEYPKKFNPDMSGVLEKLPVKMTSLEEWAKNNKEYFFNS